MGLSMTALLASVASELVVTEKLPAFGELSWVTRFSLASLIFTALALLENSVVIYLHYHTGSRLVPPWMQWLIQTVHVQSVQWKQKKQQQRKQRDTTTTVRVTQTNSRRWHQEVQVDDDDIMDDDDSSSSHLDSPNETLPALPVLLKASAAAEQQQEHRPRPRFQDGMWQHRASVRQGIKTILGRDPDDFKSHAEMENNARWQKIASHIDAFSRVVFPLVYAIYLAASFSSAGNTTM